MQMKFRKDFVTNSSSSSFVMAFRDAEAYDNFLIECGMYGYGEFADLVLLFTDDRSNPECVIKDKDEILKWVKEMCVFDKIEKLYKDPYKASNIDDFLRIKVENNALDIDKYRAEFEATIEEDPTFLAMKEKIEISPVIFKVTIFEYDYGVLGWAIRNGFIEDNFPDYLIYFKNIG